MSALGDLYLKISADTKPLKDALGKTSADVKKWSRDADTAVGKVTKSFNGLKIAIGAAVVAGAAMKGFDIMYDALTRLETLDETAKKVGVTAQKLQELNYAAEMNGSSAEEMAGALEKLHLNIGLAQNGTGKLAEVTERYGISLRNADGSIKSTQQVFTDLVKLLGETSNANERAAIAAAAFGKEMGPNLLILLSQGTSTLEEFAQKARDLGLVLSDDLVEGASEAKDKVDTLKMVIGAELTRAFADNAEEIGQWSEKAIEAFRYVISHSDDLIKITKVVAGAFAAVYAVKTIGMIIGVGKAIYEVTKALRAAAVASAALQALSGPAGWALLAGSVVAATAAYVGLNAILGDTEDGVADVTVAVEDLDIAMDDSAATINQKYTTAISNLQKKLTEGKISLEEFQRQVESLDKQRKRGIASLTAGATSGNTGDTSGKDKAASEAKKQAEAEARERESIEAKYRTDREQNVFDHEKAIADIKRLFVEDSSKQNELLLRENQRYVDENKRIDKEILKDYEERKEKMAEIVQSMIDLMQEVNEKVDPAGAWVDAKERELEMYKALGVAEKDLAEMRRLYNEEYVQMFGNSTDQMFTEWDDMAGNMRDAMNGWLQGSADAMTEFLTGGKVDFKEFANSIIKDLVRIMIQEALVRVIGGAFGGIFGSAPVSAPTGATVPSKGAGNIGSLFGKAGGGRVNGPTLVGERGPELLIPSGPSRVMNNHASQQMVGGAQDLKVEVINRSSTPVTGKQGGTRFDGKGMVTQIILEDLQKGGPISAGMGGAYGLRRKV